MTFDLDKLVRTNVRKMKPYSSARDDFQGTASVYLDANENPFSHLFSRYPDPHQAALKAKIAALKQVQPANLFLGNGSDEAIDLLIRAFCEPGRDNVVIPQPTYGMYTVSAETNAVEVRPVSLTSAFDVNAGAVLATCDSHTKLIFLCSPNNPSGNLLSTDAIERLLSAFPGLVIIDEAYIDFTGAAGWVSRLQRYPNLVILQTLSKAWGLAGLRLGLCIASSEIINVLNKIKPPYNINTATQQLALEALNYPENMIREVAQVREERDQLFHHLQNLRGVNRVFPSDANFLLIQVSDARSVYQRLIQRGIVVRLRSSLLLFGDCLRLTVGTSEENKKLLSALAEILNQPV
ncbi:MAG: histidinol-phosphate transaminase [Cyclobacteriaceae bacterium]|jgi:histidinol-phosphate aminotransferase